MKLYFTPTSPFARKARAVARERNLMHLIEEIPAAPYADDPALIQANPLGLVPALVLDDGRALFDNPVICDHLDRLGDGAGLIPEARPARGEVLTHAALADGVMTFAAHAVLEGKRPAAQRSAAVTTRAFEKITRAVRSLDSLCSGATDWHLGHVASACALGYLDFRHPGYDWRGAQPALAYWYESVQGRPALRDTVPYDPA